MQIWIKLYKVCKKYVHSTAVWYNNNVPNRYNTKTGGLITMEKPVVSLIGQNGNIFNLMCIASKALKKAGQNAQAEEMAQRIMNGAHSYVEAINIITDYVDVE